MPKPKTQYCDECVHFMPKECMHIISKKKKICGKEHRPRFYAPEFYGAFFGYKRRCEDFQSDEI